MIFLPRYKILFLFLDMLVLLSFLVIQNVSALSGSLIISKINLIVFLKILLKLVVCSSIILFVFRGNDLYKMNVILNRSMHIRRILNSMVKILLAAFLIAMLFDRFLLFQTDKIVINLLFLTPVFLVSRVFIFTPLYRHISKKYLRNNILLVGNGNFGRIISAEFFINNSLPINIIGMLNDKLKRGTEIIPGIKILGKVSEIKSVIKYYKIDEVILSYDETDYSEVLQKLEKLEELNVRVRISTELFNSINERTHPEKYYEIPLLDIHPINHSNKLQKFIIYKRIFDLFFASIGIVLLTPVYVITFILVKITSKGPAIYSQERIGKDGKVFKFYKFRSMTIDDKDDVKRQNDMLKFIESNQQGNDEYKVINENRLTKIGKIIRKTSIDELPQLFNVIKGDMSLVGPRPCLPYEYCNYKNWQKKRLNVLPGCTGFWQIFGRNKVSFLDSTVMDIYYTYVMSPLNDLEYIVRTFPAMILAKGK